MRSCKPPVGFHRSEFGNFQAELDKTGGYWGRI